MINKKSMAIFSKYADLKNQIKELTEKAKELEGKALKELEKENIDTFKSEIGTFSIVCRTRWEYSEKYKVVEDGYEMMLEAARVTEREDGTAKKSETKGIAYRSNEEK